MVMKNDSREPLPPAIVDDRKQIAAEDKVILMIEDDVEFAATLMKICRQKGFKVLVSITGEDGLKLAESFTINAIILDIHLPGMDGWAVLESLKENSSTRHIPVHFMSADDPVPEAFSKGAVGYLTKPITLEGIEKAIVNLNAMINKKMKDLLLVEDDSNQRYVINKLIRDNDVAIQEVSTGEEALAVLQTKQFDCMILDLGLPDMSGFDLLKKMKKNPLITLPPVVVYTGRELTPEEERELRRYADSIIIKGVRSEERLLDETSLFLHRVIDEMPEDKRKMISILHDPDQALQNRTILIVDDDMRNVFALSKVLNDKGANTIKAENGIKALEILSKRKDVDLVLMDIMMPVMDGYETMKKIRSESRFSRLPIIALTAKAMQQDKEDCIAAGANDYLSKPVKIDRLLSMMRVWLYR
jgi:CheY-like chemotaxis protein